MVSGIKAIDTKKSCCSKSPDFISGVLRTSENFEFSIIKTSLLFSEKLEHLRCRWGNFRNNYKIIPGIYAVNNPNAESDVFVSANYKLSFDVLRKNLSAVNCWILVLDTRGINVWCAAGKGTFGTRELISKIKSFNLSYIVNHKRIIIPQLGAVGVNASEVEEKSGFKIIFGPVRAEDIPSFLKRNYKCTESERRVKFPILERAILAPMEMYNHKKWFLLFIVIGLVIMSLDHSGFMFSLGFYNGLPFICLIVLSYLIGTLCVPIALPIIPFRSFALKGALLGCIPPILALLLMKTFLVFSNPLAICLYWIFCPMYCSYLALQFTGSSTYTSISGVKKELKIAIPIYVSISVILVILLFIYSFIAIFRNLL